MMTVQLFHCLPALQLPVAITAPPLEDYLRILPELVLSVFGMIVMFVDPLLDEDRNQKPLGTIALIGSLAALLSTFVMANHPVWLFQAWCASTASAFSSMYS